MAIFGYFESINNSWGYTRLSISILGGIQGKMIVNGIFESINNN